MKISILDKKRAPSGCKFHEGLGYGTSPLGEDFAGVALGKETKLDTVEHGDRRLAPPREVHECGAIRVHEVLELVFHRVALVELDDGIPAALHGIYAS